ncbi:MAG: SIS domain-containing protein [Oscillospiraceae bacterium]|nr:SIS domain-containing protein [Oscillospiraceae bacterium]
MKVTDLKDAKEIMSRVVAEGEKAGGFTNVVFLACGGSHACFGIGEYFLRKESKKLSVYNITANEFNCVQPASFGEQSLVFCMSLSGKTPETLNAAKLAKDRGATVVALVAEEDAPLASVADEVAYYGIEIGNTADVQNQYVVLELAVEFLNQTEGYENYGDMMNGFSRIIEVCENAKKKVQKRAIQFGIDHKDEPVVYTLGSGPNYDVAYMMSICMLMEMEWIHSSSIHCAEFFHGPFEVTDPDVPFIMFEGVGPTRCLDERALKFVRNYGRKLTLIDAKELGIDMLDESVVEFFCPILLWTVALDYSEGLAQAKKHPLLMRRYMGKVDY